MMSLYFESLCYLISICLSVRCQEVNQTTRGLPLAIHTTNATTTSNGGVSWDFIVKGELKKHNITDISSHDTNATTTVTNEAAAVMKRTREENKFWLSIIQNTLQQEYQVGNNYR